MSFIPQLRFIPPFSRVVKDLLKDTDYMMGTACNVLRISHFVIIFYVKHVVTTKEALCPNRLGSELSSLPQPELK